MGLQGNRIDRLDSFDGPWASDPGRYEPWCLESIPVAFCREEAALGFCY